MVTWMSFRTTFLLFVKFSYCPLSLSFINSLHYNTKKAKLKSRGRWKGYFPLRPWIPSRTKHVVRQRREGWTSREVLGRRIGSKSLLLWRHNGRPPSVQMTRITVNTNKKRVFTDVSENQDRSPIVLRSLLQRRWIVFRGPLRLLGSLLSVVIKSNLTEDYLPFEHQQPLHSS